MDLNVVIISYVNELKNGWNKGIVIQEDKT